MNYKLSTLVSFGKTVVVKNLYQLYGVLVEIEIGETKVREVGGRVPRRRVEFCRQIAHWVVSGGVGEFEMRRRTAIKGAEFGR